MSRRAHPDARPCSWRTTSSIARCVPAAWTSSSARRALKDQLAVSLEAAAARGEALDHVLLAGPPGLGKTSLAQILAAELDVPFVMTAAPALERKGDVAAFLTALEPRSIFFVDEIHRLSRALEETFYPAMEDRQLPITVGQGAGARVVTLDLPPFTLVGATTRAGRLTTPLRDRFGIQHRLEPYGTAELGAIVRAQRADPRRRSSPRTARRRSPAARVARRGWPTACSSASATSPRCVRTASITAAVADDALGLLEVDHLGLERLDREHPRRDLREVRRRTRSACRRSRSPSARRPTRSRTSTSPTCCSAACSSARRAAVWRPSAPTATSASRRRRTRRCSGGPTARRRPGAPAQHAGRARAAAGSGAARDVDTRRARRQRQRPAVDGDRRRRAEADVEAHAAATERPRGAQRPRVELVACAVVGAQVGRRGRAQPDGDQAAGGGPAPGAAACGRAARAARLGGRAAAPRPLAAGVVAGAGSWRRGRDRSSWSRGAGPDRGRRGAAAPPSSWPAARSTPSWPWPAATAAVVAVDQPERRGEPRATITSASDAHADAAPAARGAGAGAGVQRDAAAGGRLVERRASAGPRPAPAPRRPGARLRRRLGLAEGGQQLLERRRAVAGAARSARHGRSARRPRGRRAGPAARHRGPWRASWQGRRSPDAGPTRDGLPCPQSDGPPLHLPQLRQPHRRDRAHRRLPRAAQGLHEVRLRLPVRAARRLLPGARRRLLRLRPARAT